MTCSLKYLILDCLESINTYSSRVQGMAHTAMNSGCISPTTTEVYHQKVCEKYLPLRSHLHCSAHRALTGPKILRAQNTPMPTEASTTFFSWCKDCLLGVATSYLHGSATEYFQGGLKMAIAFASPGTWCRELAYEELLLTLPAVASLKKNARNIQILFLLFGIFWLASHHRCIGWSLWPVHLNWPHTSELNSVLPGRMP